MIKDLDAILFYSHADLQLAEEFYQVLIGAGLTVWFAEEDLPYGSEVQEGINAAFLRSRHALICIGANGLGAFQKGEWNAAYTAARKGTLSAVPVLLPGALDSVIDDDLFLAGIKYVDLRDGIDRRPATRRKLIELLSKGRSLASSIGDPWSASKNDGDPQHVGPPGLAETAAPVMFGTISDQFVKQIRRAGLTVFVGATWPERHQRLVPNQQAIAAQILEELGVAQAEAPRAVNADVIMTADQAAFALCLRDADAPTTLERIVRAFIAPRSLGEPDSYAQLVHVLGSVAAETQDRDTVPAMLVTTNIDLGMERAFLKQLVPFTRLVYDCRKRAFLWSDFRSARDGDGRIVLMGHEEPLVERRESEADADHLRKARAFFDKLPSSARKGEFQELWRTLELNRLVELFHGRTYKILDDPQDASGQSFNDTVVVKLHGSYDIPSSCVISTDHYFQLAQDAVLLPNTVRATISEHPTLLLGYHLTEPTFIQLYEICLRAQFQKSPDWLRLALLQPSDEVRDNQDRIDQALLRTLVRPGQRVLTYITPLLVERPAKILSDLHKRLAALKNDAWAKESPF